MRGPLFVGSLAATLVLVLVAGAPAGVLFVGSVGFFCWRASGHRPVRRARRRRVWSDEERRFILERDSWACVECGAQDELEIDHVIPFSRGGACTVENAQVLCRTHNARKGAS
jgi:5-methylcytosine-specific restriction endonuclease McrA